MNEINNTEINEEVMDEINEVTTCDPDEAVDAAPVETEEKEIGLGGLLLGATVVAGVGYAVGKGVEFAVKKIGAIPAVANAKADVKAKLEAAKEKKAAKKLAKAQEKCAKAVEADPEVKPEIVPASETPEKDKDDEKKEKKSGKK